MILLEVRELGKTFFIHHLGRKIVALRGINFALQEGEFKLVSGRNGAGKSTLLRCIYRSCLPTEGSILYHSLSGTVDLARAADEDVVLLRNTEISYVPQFLRPRPRVSALEWVAEPLWRRGMDRAHALREAGAALEAFGLRPELWQAFPATFSGGEQQKVNLARALIVPSRLLLLDEPTASLDLGARMALAERLGHLKANGVAILGVFHHREDVDNLVDSVLDLSPVEQGHVDDQSQTGPL